MLAGSKKFYCSYLEIADATSFLDPRGFRFDGRDNGWLSKLGLVIFKLIPVSLSDFSHISISDWSDMVGNSKNDESRSRIIFWLGELIAFFNLLLKNNILVKHRASSFKKEILLIHEFTLKNGKTTVFLVDEVNNTCLHIRELDYVLTLPGTFSKT